MQRKSEMSNIDSRFLPPPVGIEIACWLVKTEGREGTTTSEVEAAFADTAEPLIKLSDHIAAIAAMNM
jgi:hypothetical protein